MEVLHFQLAFPTYPFYKLHWENRRVFRESLPLRQPKSIVRPIPLICLKIAVKGFD